MLFLVGTLLVGVVIGLIAPNLTHSESNTDWVAMMLLAILGAWLGSCAGTTLGLYASGSSSGWIASTFGAVLLVYVFCALRNTYRHLHAHFQ